MLRISGLAFLALVALSGCSQKGAFDMFKMDTVHEKAIEQLRSGTILLSMETKAIISTLYLNKIDPSAYRDGEYFVAAVYFQNDDIRDRNRTIQSDGYTLTMNGKAPESVRLLEERDPLRQLMPVQNNWNRYYLIRFAQEKGEALSLRFEKNQTGSVELNYSKLP